MQNCHTKSVRVILYENIMTKKFLMTGADDGKGYSRDDYFNRVLGFLNFWIFNAGKGGFTKQFNLNVGQMFFCAKIIDSK